MNILIRKNLLILAAIILAGLLLRTLFITSSPPSLYGDELTITLDAYSILKTGQDQLGNFLPLTFQMGAGRPAGYVYGSIPFIGMFGPGELGVRGLSILSGVLIMVFLFLLGRKLFSWQVGIIAAGISAFSPWAISLSRGGFEANFALFLALLGVYFFIKAKEAPKYYILSFLSLGLTIHTYPTYKVTLLLFIPLLFWFVGSEVLRKNRKYLLSGLVIVGVLGLLALSQTFFGGSEKRFSDINIFSQDSLKAAIEQKINLERQITEIPADISKYLHNKPVEYGKVLIENYLQNFGIDFLILHGDRNPRHNMATMGEIYLVDLVFIIGGLLAFWAKTKKKILFLIFWLLIAPIPTAIVDLPHALRSAFMLPPLVILSSLGLLTLINNRRRILLLIISVLFAIQSVFFLQKLYFLAPAEYGNFWSYPAKLAAEQAMENRDNFSLIFLSDSIDSLEFAYPVYAKEDPDKIIKANQTAEKIGTYTFKRYGNVYIGHIPDSDTERFLNDINQPVLYIGPSGMKNFLKDYETINGKDNLPSLVLKRL